MTNADTARGVAKQCEEECPELARLLNAVALDATEALHTANLATQALERLADRIAAIGSENTRLLLQLDAYKRAAVFGKNHGDAGRAALIAATVGEAS
jgi:hypothetical protein